MKKTSIILFILLIMFTQSVFSYPSINTPLQTEAKLFDHSPVKLEIPPLPTTDLNNAEQLAIFMLKDDMYADEIHRLLEKYPDIQLRKIFKYALNGFSAKGSSERLAQLAKEEPITKVSSVNQYKVFGIPMFQQTDNMDIIGRQEVRGMFDKQHNRLTGKGVKIGVIDTGIDYRHGDLRESYGGGYDIVDGDDDPMETNGESSGEPGAGTGPPYGMGTLHGTHVAGIIAANGRMQGVAPEATILAYRALGPGGMGTTEQVIAAIEQAIIDKVDIINLSLGSNVNGPDLPLSVALNKAVEHGITAVTSSGNSGPHVWTVGSPGTASKAISVGASTPTMKIPYLKDRSGELIRLEPMQGSIEWDIDRQYELANGGIGHPQQLKNMKGKIALIERGVLTFSEKVDNAVRAGAAAVIIYNNLQGSFTGNLDQKSSIPVMSINKKAGKRLKSKISAGETNVDSIIIEETDFLADFSSRGPVTSTWEIKPDLLAPGVAINSTVPGGYLSLQGTSMSSPHVAGACALIKQAHPDWEPEKIKAALMNNAKQLRNRRGIYYKTYEQGAGRMQLKEAIEAEVLAYPASLKFGKFQLEDKLHEQTELLTIENTGTKRRNISFSVPKQEKGIEWHLPMSFYLKGGEKRQIEIKMSADAQMFKQKIQDGTLTIHAGGQDIRVPYLFVLEEPNYPRVMGFDFGAGDDGETFRYEVYLPGGADEFGIALFDPDTYQFIQFLDWKRNTGKGLLQQELKKDQFPEAGVYLVKVFSRKAGREDVIETFLEIPDSRMR